MIAFTTLGVGDAFSALYYSSCLLVESGGTRLLIDCPHPVRKMLAEAGAATNQELDLDTVDAVVLTHLHADHASGLEGYGYFSHFALKRPAKLVVHPAVSERLWDGHLAAGMECLMSASDHRVDHKGLADYFDLVPLAEDRPVQVGSFTIRCRRTVHHVPTTALSLSAGGRTLGYSADTCFDPGLISWLSEADLFVHETNLGVHTPYADLAALPAHVRAKMRLIHYPDGFDSADHIEMLRQGRRYVIGGER